MLRGYWAMSDEPCGSCRVLDHVPAIDATFHSSGVEAESPTACAVPAIELIASLHSLVTTTAIASLARVPSGSLLLTHIHHNMATAASPPLLPEELLQRTISLAFLSSPSATSPTAPSVFIPRGLVNVSNRCYLSSVFQCLLATRPFASHLHQCLDSAPLSTLRPCLASVADVAATYAEVVGFVAEYQKTEQVGAVRANVALTSVTALPRVPSPALTTATHTSTATSQVPPASQLAPALNGSALPASPSAAQSSLHTSSTVLIAPRPVVASTSSSSLSDLRSDHGGSPPPAAENDEWNVTENKAMQASQEEGSQTRTATTPRTTTSDTIASTTHKATAVSTSSKMAMPRPRQPPPLMSTQ